MRVDMSMETREDVRVGVRTDACADVDIDMCTDVCIDGRTEMCIGMCVGMGADVHETGPTMPKTKKKVEQRQSGLGVP